MMNGRKKIGYDKWTCTAQWYHLECANLSNVPCGTCMALLIMSMENMHNIVITYCSIPYCILTMCNRVTCECKVIHVHACAYIILYPWKCKWYHYYCIVHKLVSCNVCMLAHSISFARLQFNSVQVMCKQCIYIYTYILYIFI